MIDPTAVAASSQTRSNQQWETKNYADLLQRIVNLEQQVANQALMNQRTASADELHTALKSQTAAAQATEHLYAPLRSDTKPLLEMSAFVRKVASTPLGSAAESWASCRALINEAQEILRRST